ncbi:MAG: hypothetical protein ACPGO3_12535 [Magnetospiraceae bacterium]
MVTRVRSVARMETVEFRQRSFEEIAQRHALIAWTNRFYNRVRQTFLAQLMLLAFGTKMFLGQRVEGVPDAALLSTAVFNNEKRALHQIAACAPGVSCAQISHSNRYMFSPASLLALIACIGALPQLWRLSRLFARRYSFMPACRVFSVLFYYVRAKHLLRRLPTVKAVMTASTYAPDAMGVAAAADSAGLKMIYTNHANLAPKLPIITPIHASLAILHGQSMVDIHARNQAMDMTIVLKGVDGPCAPLRAESLPDQGFRVGLFLTSLCDFDEMRRLIATATQHYAAPQVLVRPHPNPYLTGEHFQSLAESDSKTLFISQGRSLAEDLAQCDLALCGNSSVVLEILRAGVPVLYDRGLDANPYDYNGFVEQGLIPELTSPETFDLPALRQFYGGDWIDRMRYYDARYLTDGTDACREIGMAINALLPS